MRSGKSVVHPLYRNSCLRLNDMAQDLRGRVQDRFTCRVRVGIQRLHDRLHQPREVTVQHKRLLADEEDDELHHGLAVLDAARVEDVDRERRHEQRRVARGDLEDRRARLETDVRYGNRFFLGRRREREEGAEHLYRVDVLLPDLEPTGAEVDSQRSVWRCFVVQVSRNGFCNVSECTTRRNCEKAFSEES